MKTNKYQSCGITFGERNARGIRSVGIRLASSATLALVCLSAIATSAHGQTDGHMVLQNLTIPRGGVFLAGNLGGHWWVPDAGFGLCRIDPLVAGNPPWQLSNCQGAAKSAGQVVVANPQAGVTNVANAKLVFVPDSSSKSDNVVRFIFNPANETMSSPLNIPVPPINAGPGGTSSRPIGAALSPNGNDVYVSSIRSGDILMIQGANGTAPTSSVIGSTSDGSGTFSIAMYKNDLYISEQGGFGLSKMADPSGLQHAPCSSTGICRALSLLPQISSFPGGLATDGNVLYVGDSPFTTPGRILSWNSATGIVTTVSTNVTPAYTSAFDGVTRNQYFNPYGIAVDPRNGDLYVGDDPTAGLRVPVLPTLQGHLWRIPAAPAPPTVTNLSLNQGGLAGGDVVVITGTGFSTTPGQTTVSFGAAAAPVVNCASTTSCTVTSPSSAGPGVVDVRVFVVGVGSPAVPADLFTYVANTAPGAPTVTNINPKSGVLGGGTVVTITGTNLAGGFVTFGVTAAASVTCSVDGLSCTATSPAGTGTVDIQVTNALALTSAAVPSDQFTYVAPSASIFAWGITAPKGGMVWVPGSLGGHWWSSDHSSGFCRQDVVPGTTLHAINASVCDDGSIGSPGQAVYDARVNPAFVNSTTGAAVPAGTHFIYVPDNAVKSTAIWRLTFDPNTETIVGAPEAEIPLANVRTLKPNGMALGPDGNLYVTDLTEMNIRKVTGPNGDPRLQTVSIVAQTGDGRGANGTIGFLGNNLYISENRAAAWFDITSACALGLTGIPCTTTPIPLQPGVFVSGVATDPVNNFVYASDSPGAGNATIWRYSPATGVVSIYLTGGNLPAAGTPNATVWCTTTCTRPWDPSLAPGGIGTFSFAFGIVVGPDGSLYVTEDPTAGQRSGRGKAWIAPLVQ